MLQHAPSHLDCQCAQTAPGDVLHVEIPGASLDKVAIIHRVTFELSLAYTYGLGILPVIWEDT